VVEAGHPQPAWITRHITGYSRDVTGLTSPPGEVPGEELAFNFRSGRPCLAFVATVGQRWRAEHERLREPADLARWYVEAGLLDEPLAVTPAGLRTARTLREAIYRMARDVIGEEPSAAADEAVLNAAAGHPPLIPVLRSATSRLALPADGGENAALSTLARDAVDLFSSPTADRIRECASPECGLLFVDTSRPGRRRWCSSTACGTKERSATYRRRKRARD
jgi:predicted RNA-binding Zn ribbon-like protein